MRSRLAAAVAALLLCATSAQALEIRTDAVWWQYEEVSSKLPGFSSTPFHSKASSITLAITTIEDADINHEWGWRSEVSAIVPTVQAVEAWHNPANQHNDLRIAQFEGQLALLRKFDGFDLGVWGALRWHQQDRSNLNYSGGGTFAIETIRSAWLGASLSGSWWRITTGTPIWVYVTNSSMTTTFSKRDGFRAGIEIYRPLAEWLGDTIHLHGAYHYQQIGGDLKSFGVNSAALWPKNRFQTVSLGLSAEW